MTAEITLQDGTVVLVDDADAALVHAWNWRWGCKGKTARGYIVRSTRQSPDSCGTLYLHREIMGRPKNRVRFKTDNHLDCRRQNLEIVIPFSRAGRKEIARAFVNEINARTSCAHCGKQPIEWHNPEHAQVPGRKAYRISNMVVGGRTPADIKIEMERCTPLCVRCHRAEDGRQVEFMKKRPFQKGHRNPPRICDSCGRLRQHFALGLCDPCYQTARRRAAGQQPMGAQGVSRHRGVTWDNVNLKWRASFVDRGKKYHLGRFINEEDAAEAVRVARLGMGLR